MTAPIPVSRARKAVAAMQRLGEMAEAQPWVNHSPDGPLVTNGEEHIIFDLRGWGLCIGGRGMTGQQAVDWQTANGDFIVAARACHSALWNYMNDELEHCEDAGQVSDFNPIYAPLAAAIAHLDATQPGWEEV